MWLAQGASQEVCWAQNEAPVPDLALVHGCFVVELKEAGYHPLSLAVTMSWGHGVKRTKSCSSLVSKEEIHIVHWFTGYIH